MSPGNSRKGWNLAWYLLYSSCNGINLSWLLFCNIQASNQNYILTLPLYSRVVQSFRGWFIKSWDKRNEPLWRCSRQNIFPKESPVLPTKLLRSVPFCTSWLVQSSPSEIQPLLQLLPMTLQIVQWLLAKSSYEKFQFGTTENPYLTLSWHFTASHFLSSAKISYHKFKKCDLRSITSQRSKQELLAWWWEWLNIFDKVSGCSAPGRIRPQRILDFSSQVNNSVSTGFGWLICLRTLLSYTTQIALLYYTSQCVISLLYCEKHSAITSYIVSSEVFWKERKKNTAC